MAAIKKILLLLFLLVSIDLYADDGWQLVTDKNGIKVYQKQQPGRPFKHTKGVSTVQANTAAVFALLNDLAACEHWIYGCLEANKQADDSIYMVFKGPPLFKDREVVLVSRVQYLRKTKQWLISVENVPHQAVNLEHVMIHSIQAQWLLTVESKNQLTIEHTFYIDPNVKVKFGANRYNSRAIFKTLQAMPDMLRLSKYKAQQKLPSFIQKLKNQ